MSILSSVRSKLFGSPAKTEYASDFIRDKQAFFKESYSVGADLLKRYQDMWENLHNTTEENSLRAEAADEEISKLTLKIMSQGEVLSSLLEQLTQLPHLADALQTTMDRMGNLEADFHELETLLLGLEDLCEEREVCINRQQHYAQLELHKKRKLFELGKVKGSMHDQHLKHVEAHEVQLQKALRERQNEYEEAFKQEIDNYRRYGQLGKKRTEHTAPVALADIAIDYDHSALDQFLDSDENHATNATGEEVMNQASVIVDDIKQALQSSIEASNTVANSSLFIQSQDKPETQDSSALPNNPTVSKS